MKNALLVCCVLLVASQLPALDAYPKTSVAEDATATWCTYCPNAYAGLDIVHGQFDASQFLSVRYYETSGSYGTTETDARNDFYQVTGFPTVTFDGLTQIVGAGSTTASTGEPYLSVVGGNTLVPAPVKLEIDSFNATTGAVSATVTMYSTTAALNNDTLLFVLLEDEVAPGHTHVARDLVYETVTLTGAGSSTTVNTSFTINPAWTTANLYAVALVQQVADKEVLQSASTYTQPAYNVRGMVPFARTGFGPSSGTFMTGDVTVMNTGLADGFTISLVVDSAPAGWTFSFDDETGTTHTSPYGFSLGNEASTFFAANVMPTSPGQAEFHFEVTSTNLAAPLIIPFTYYTDDLDVMIIDDDGGDPYETYFTEALDTAGMTYGIFDRDTATVPVEIAQTYSTIIWNVGWGFPSLDDDDKPFIDGFLADGKSLFLSGQDIGWDLNDPGGSPDPVWYQTTLHANYVRDDTNILDLDGVAGDPITDGLTLHIAGGTGANNQAYPDEIGAADADATVILNYSGDGGGAIRVIDSTSGGRIVYLGFGFEGIADAQDRYDLLIPSLDWLNGVFADGFESGDASAWSSTVP
jgi:hypothetical protein